MIPRGPIFNALRSEMIATFPEGSKAIYGDCGTIGEWLSTGSIVVKTCTKSKVTFDAPQAEFGVILLTEIENLLNHCFEHLQELGCVSCDTRVRSDAWNTVTSYYLTFFSGSTLLRLLGRPVVFIKRAQLSSFPELLGSGVAPSQGTYEIQRTGLVSATHAEFSLKPTKKIHEATWLILLGYLDQLRKRNVNNNVVEALFYQSLCSKTLFSQYVNFQWPSLVRNRANYRPGFAYKLGTARHLNWGLIDEWVNMDPPDANRIINEAVKACDCDSENFEKHVRLMVAVGTSLFLLARELYSELLERKTLDRRWEYKRRAYRKSMVFSEAANKLVARTF